MRGPGAGTGVVFGSFFGSVAGVALAVVLGPPLVSGFFFRSARLSPGTGAGALRVSAPGRPPVPPGPPLPLGEVLPVPADGAFGSPLGLASLTAVSLRFLARSIPEPSPHVAVVVVFGFLSLPRPPAPPPLPLPVGDVVLPSFPDGPAVPFPPAGPPFPPPVPGDFVPLELGVLPWSLLRGSALPLGFPVPPGPFVCPRPPPEPCPPPLRPPPLPPWPDGPGRPPDAPLFFVPPPEAWFLLVVPVFLSALD